VPSELSDSHSGHAQLVVELVSDSFRGPSTVGVRSTSKPVRHLVYEVGSLLIELRFEFSPEFRRFSLTGQVSSSEEGAATVDQMPVQLRFGQDVLIRTLTDRFGQFSLEHETERNVQIRFTVSDNFEFSITLDQAFWKTSRTGL
jgi:hypothetical protein